jgi:hypothetical protein
MAMLALVNRSISRQRNRAKIQAAAPWNNGTNGTSGKDGSIGVGVGASVSTSVTGIGWRRIGALRDTTKST